MSFGARAGLHVDDMRPQAVVHLELHTGDLAGAREFCALACALRSRALEPSAGRYVALDLGAGIGGGIVECPAPRPLWLPYVEVADIAAATDRARLAGARVLLAPREGPGGWRSVIASAAAGEIAFWQLKR